jgi:hypothetical protein
MIKSRKYTLILEGIECLERRNSNGWQENSDNYNNPSVKMTSEKLSIPSLKKREV